MIMDKWRGYEFESSSRTTKEFDMFSRDFKKVVEKCLPDGVKLAEYRKGHFEVSGFIEKGGRYVYFSISDVRFFQDKWQSEILVRKAESLSDFTGGMNHYTSLERFRENVSVLIRES